MPETVTPYVWIDKDGKARLVGGGFKVRILAELHTRCGLSVEKIAEDYPQINLVQIHGGLAYYYEHKEEFDAEMDRLDQMEKELRANAPPSPFAARMRAEGRLS